MENKEDKLIPIDTNDSVQYKVQKILKQ